MILLLKLAKKVKAHVRLGLKLRFLSDVGKDIRLAELMSEWQTR